MVSLCMFLSLCFYVFLNACREITGIQAFLCKLSQKGQVEETSTAPILPRHDPWDCHICRSVGVMPGGVQLIAIYGSPVFGVSGYILASISELLIRDPDVDVNNRCLSLITAFIETIVVRLLSPSLLRAPAVVWSINRPPPVQRRQQQRRWTDPNIASPLELQQR